MLLSKKTYGQVIKNLDYYKKQHEEDRKENPQHPPIDWQNSIRSMIERTVRENHEGCPKGLAEQVMRHLAEKKILVPYLGGYTFPTNEKLPTEDEVRKQTEQFLTSMK